MTTFCKITIDIENGFYEAVSLEIF